MTPFGFPTADSETSAPAIEQQDSASSRDYVFWGRHFIASYNGCDLDRLTSPQLIQTLHEAVEASGASLLSQAVHVFPNGGMTAVFLLSESHASIHTYPEHSACFVDLFTCGDRCRSEDFDAVLRKYLLPKFVNAKVIFRHESNEDANSLEPVKAEG